jgi:hypothetical protein
MVIRHHDRLLTKKLRLGPERRLLAASSLSDTGGSMAQSTRNGQSINQKADLSAVRAP